MLLRTAPCPPRENQARASSIVNCDGPFIKQPQQNTFCISCDAVPHQRRVIALKTKWRSTEPQSLPFRWSTYPLRNLAFDIHESHILIDLHCKFSSINHFNGDLKCLQIILIDNSDRRLYRIWMSSASGASAVVFIPLANARGMINMTTLQDRLRIKGNRSSPKVRMLFVEQTMTQLILLSRLSTDHSKLSLK